MTDPTTVTDVTATPADADPAFEDLGSAPMPPPASSGARRRSPFSGLRRTAGGLGAVGVKELRGRMRGRRAFVILSVYLVLLAGFTWMVELMMERTYSTGFGGNAAFASAAIGQGIFVGLIMLETLLVAFLAPLATAGSISLEREKQTLEMLAATPITSFAIVFGKLLSALIWVWLLIAASIPLTAVVFLFGGVAPDDIVHAYLVLVVTALGFGSFGLFCSSLVKRTQAATAVTIFGVLAISMGTLFGIFFWQSLATTDLTVRDAGPIRGPAPAPIVFLNPFLAQTDVAPAEVLCAGDNALRYYCRFRQLFMLDQAGIVFVDVPRSEPGQAVPPVAIDRVPNDLPLKVAPPVNVGGPIQVSNVDVVPFGGGVRPIWEQTVIAWLVLSLVFLLLSVQFVSPTRRWRLPSRSTPRRTA
jgi:ABC-type transport system involved in multi-copper enzyme maturation permease subunit